MNKFDNENGQQNFNVADLVEQIEQNEVFTEESFEEEIDQLEADQAGSLEFDGDDDAVNAEFEIEINDPETFDRNKTEADYFQATEQSEPEADQVTASKEVLISEVDAQQKPVVASIPPKPKKWDDASTAQLLALWGNSDSLPDDERKEKIDQIAAIMGRNDRQITMKLSREKVYTPRTYQAKTGGVKRDDLALTLAVKAGLNETEMLSFAKGSKTGLQKILAKLQ